MKRWSRERRDVARSYCGGGEGGFVSYGLVQ